METVIQTLLQFDVGLMKRFWGGMLNRSCVRASRDCRYLSRTRRVVFLTRIADLEFVQRRVNVVAKVEPVGKRWGVTGYRNSLVIDCNITCQKEEDSSFEYTFKTHCKLH